MKFECPKCSQRLSVAATAAGLMVRCPSCDNRVKVPLASKGERRAWKETDPTNPNPFLSLGITLVVLLLWFLLLLPFVPPAGTPTSGYSTMQFLSSLFYKHFLVSFINTMFFVWAMSIIFLKHLKIRHQKAAMMLDVLPPQLGKEIDGANVGVFIDHVYSLPHKLRDSLMVNRIRKALELFEIRQNVAEVREMMASQSEIDSGRISGSFSLLRAFLWGIPLLGFIGTVIGLSHAIGGMSFGNVEDVSKIVGSINNVTSGLGTAFDATLLGLVLALILNFPLNALAKQEDDNLQTIDAFCNEVLLPRLKDTTAALTIDSSTVANALALAIAGSQEKFIVQLNQLAQQMGGYAAEMEKRMATFQETVTEEIVTRNAEMREQSQLALNGSLEQVSRYIGGLEAGIGGLNKVLKELGERQVVVQAPPRRRWFWRS
jgi:biopolymer transport protein ExbB/TolQ